MKSTSLVRGAISDIVRPPATTVSISSTSPAIAQTNSLITPSAIPSTMANGGMSLATQLSLAMMNGVFFQGELFRAKLCCVDIVVTQLIDATRLVAPHVET